MDPVQQLRELLQQIQKLAGVGVDALSQGGDSKGAGPQEGGQPPEAQPEPAGPHAEGGPMPPKQ